MKKRMSRAFTLLLAALLLLSALAPSALASATKHPPERINNSWMNMQDGWYALMEEMYEDVDPETAQFMAACVAYGDMSFDLGMTFAALAQDGYDVTKAKKDGAHDLIFSTDSSQSKVTKKGAGYSMTFASEVIKSAKIKFSVQSGAFHLDAVFRDNDQCPTTNYLDLLPVNLGFYTCYIFQDDDPDAYGTPLVIKQYMDRERIYIVVDALKPKAKISQQRLSSAPKSYKSLAGKDSIILSLTKDGVLTLTHDGDTLKYKKS